MRSFRIIALASGNDLAEGLILGSEVGVLHLRAVSKVIGKKIRVWDTKGRVLGVFHSSEYSRFTKSEHFSTNDKLALENNYGRSADTNDVDFVRFTLSNWFGKNSSYKESEANSKAKLDEGYLDLHYQLPSNSQPGHWFSINSEISKPETNNCFFDAVCQQCSEYEPHKLRILTADVIRQQGIIIEEGFPQFYGTGCFLLGGAKYNGKSNLEATIIIDNSQGTRGHGHVARAHPRGHASHHDAEGDMDSVEKYSRHASRENPKSAWLSRGEQDSALHKLLIRNECQEAMEKLNRGATREVIKLSPGFEITMGLWANGVMFSGPLIAEFVTILLQHHAGRQEDPDADVQIFTCYPMAPPGSERQNKMSLFKQLETKRSLSPSDENEYEPTKKILKINH